MYLFLKLLSQTQKKSKYAVLAKQLCINSYQLWCLHLLFFLPKDGVEKNMNPDDRIISEKNNVLTCIKTTPFDPSDDANYDGHLLPLPKGLVSTAAISTDAVTEEMAKQEKGVQPQHLQTDFPLEVYGVAQSVLQRYPFREVARKYCDCGCNARGRFTLNSELETRHYTPQQLIAVALLDEANDTAKEKVENHAEREDAKRRKVAIAAKYPLFNTTAVPAIPCASSITEEHLGKCNDKYEVLVSDHKFKSLNDPATIVKFTDGSGGILSYLKRDADQNVIYRHVLMNMPSLVCKLKNIGYN